MEQAKEIKDYNEINNINDDLGEDDCIICMQMKDDSKLLGSVL